MKENQAPIVYAGYEHIDDMILSQGQLIKDILSGKVTHDRAREITRAVNATLSACRNQLQYAALSGDLRIPFFESRKTIEVLPSPLPDRAITQSKRAIA